MKDKRVLIIEDNELNSDMLSRRLIRIGFVVSTAFDGKSGIQKTRELLPDLIILDIRLPDIDGREVAKQLKADSSTKHIPILALTASVADADRERAIFSGCDEFDTKPIDWARLMNKIGHLIGP